MHLESTRTVREFALEIPGATRVFERLGIDYCCNGSRSLGEACMSAGTRIEEVLHSLEEMSLGNEKGQKHFQTAALSELIKHIVETHHGFTRQEISWLSSLTEKVLSVHGDRHPELLQLRCLFRELCNDLETHMMKEERVLFPCIIRTEAAVQQQVPLTRPPFGSLANPMRMMMLEHDRAGELMKEMRKISSDFTPPPDACLSYQTLYEALETLEKDLHQHIHLENNILFPRAVEIEAALIDLQNQKRSDHMQVTSSFTKGH